VTAHYLLIGLAQHCLIGAHALFQLSVLFCEVLQAFDVIVHLANRLLPKHQLSLKLLNCGAMGLRAGSRLLKFFDTILDLRF
jgi:hypothetical protein